MQSEEVSPEKALFEQRLMAADLVYTVCTILVALLISYGVVIRLATWCVGAPSWVYWLCIVVVAAAAWVLTATQGTTHPTSFSILGGLYNDCPWMKWRTPDFESSMVASVVAVLAQTAIIVYATGWCFWAGTIFVGWVIIPHAGLWRERFD